MSKTAMPKHIDRATFTDTTPALTLHLGRDADVVKGPDLKAPARQFSTGSLGWGTSEKVTIMVAGKPVLCQLSYNLTIVGSKPEPTK